MDALVDEWRRSRGLLSDIVGEDIRVASVPGGFYSGRVARAAAEAGIRILFNSEPWSAPRRSGELLVLGRFGIVSSTPPQSAASLAAGRVLPRLAQYLFWNAKKVPKTLCGAAYRRARSRLLGRHRPDAA